MSVIVADFAEEGPTDGTPGPEHFPRPNWDRAPWSRWSFLHTRQLFPAAEIRRQPGAQATLTRAPQEIDRIRFALADGDRASVGEMLDATQTNGFLVIHRGRIVTERYFGGMAADAEHLGLGLTAAVTGAAAAALIGAGRLDPDAPVTDYLPELSTTAWRGARIRHVMDMTTAVRFSERHDDPGSDLARLDVAAGLRPAPPGGGRRAWPGSLLEQMLGLVIRDADHGARHAYRSVDAVALGLVIARVEGLPLADAVSRRIWGPIGAEADARITVDPMGVALADRGLSARLRDYGRFGRMILDGGEVDGRRVVPARWVDRLLAGDHGLADDALRATFPHGVFRDMFRVEDKARQTVASIGAFGQLLYISPEDDIVAVKLSSWPRPEDPAMTDMTLRALRAIAAELG